MENDVDTGLVLLCAVRYAIGRRTYMPGLIVDWAMRHWTHIKCGTRNLILTEINDYVASGRSLGDECDAKTWLGFRDWIQRQGGIEGEQ